MTPRVSVVIPVFNGERFVADAVKSALAQSLRELEVIVVDDGSEDSTPDVVDALSDDRIRYVRQENQGLAGARNRGIEEAGADLIAFLDADDLWFPCKLTKQLAGMRSDAVVYSDVAFWDAATGRVIGPYEVFDRFPGDRSKFSGDILLGLLGQNFVHPSSVVLHRDRLQEVGPFDPGLLLVEDWDLWLRLAERVPFRRVDAPLVLVRRRADSLQSDATGMTACAEIVLQRAAHRLAEQGRLHDDARYSLALGHFSARSARARTQLLTAALRRPWALSRWRWALASSVRPLIRGQS